MRKYLLPLAAAVVLASAASAFALQVNDNFNSTITIQADCQIQLLEDLSFGTHGVLDSTRTASADLDIQCTNATVYGISFDAVISDGSVTDLMTNANGQDVQYTADLSATGAVGNGNLQSFTIDGTVLAQTTPSPATYSDTLTVYVTY